MAQQMAGSMGAGVEALTDKEKQTLRLLLEGHDAKSMARHFGLSVHTVNERLRDARRKLAVSSSKEAARRLYEAERASPETMGDASLGDVALATGGQVPVQPGASPPPHRRGAWVIGGSAMLLLFAAMLALTTPTPTPVAPPEAGTPAPVAATAAGTAARAWLTLVDAARWPESWAATGAPFRAVNSVATWQAASERARVPLGRVLSRTLVEEQDTPAPPNGYRTVRFHTDFAHRANATETVSLDREDGDWKVVGIYIE